MNVRNLNLIDIVNMNYSLGCLEGYNFNIVVDQVGVVCMGKCLV